MSNGIIFTRSEFGLKTITDGTSQTYLIGEKYVDPKHYEDGNSAGDDQGPYVSDDRDSVRWAEHAVPPSIPGLPPLPDTPGADLTYSFGSAHPTGLYMARCDGSVHRVSYDIDNRVHVYLANRNDEQAVDGL